MKVKGLDGRIHSWNLFGKQPMVSEQGGSSGHSTARKIIGKLFPLDRVLEEVTLPGSGSLRADFFLPNRKIIIEIQGIQHRKFVPFFHKTRLGFIESLKRDGLKRDWCELNSIILIELPDDEDEQLWENRILKSGVNQ